MSALLAAFACYLLAEALGNPPGRLGSGNVPEGAVAPILFLLIAIGLGLGLHGTLRGMCFKVIGGGLLIAGAASLLLNLAPIAQDSWREPQRLGASLPSGFFLLFGLAMLYVHAHWRRLPLKPERLHRSVAVIGVSLSTLFWLLTGWEEHRVEVERSSHVADVVKLHSERAISHHEQLMARMAERWNLLGGLPMASLREQEVESYFRDHPTLKGIAFIDGTGRGDWSRAPDAEARSRLEAQLDADGVRERLVSQEEALQWFFPDQDQPLKALVSLRLPDQPETRLVASIELDLLLARIIRPELGGYELHLKQSSSHLLEVNEQDRDPANRASAISAVATSIIDFSSDHTLRAVIVGGPPAPWSGSAILSTGVGGSGLLLSYLLAFCVGVMSLSQVRAQRLDRTNHQLEEQYRAQALIAREPSYVMSLEAVCRMLEQQLPGKLCSIMLCDETQTHFKEAIGPSLPHDYLKALKGLPIDPSIGACGDAVSSRKLVICEDLATDARWKGYHDLAQQHRLGACWSFPVVSPQGQVLGTVALYHSVPGTPSEDERQLAMKAVDLVSLAIGRHHDHQAIANSENRYRSLFTYHPDAAYSMDLDGKILSVNSQSEELIGLPADQIIGKNFTHFIETADLHDSRVRFERALAGQAMRAVVRIRDGQGRPRVLDVTNIPVITNGRVTGIFGIGKDITERKADEARLLTLERCVESSINGISIVDATQPDMPLTFVNQAFCHITGYDKDEVEGRNCRFLQGPETDSRAVLEIRRSLASGREVNVTLCNYRKNGERFWNELQISPVSNGHGDITHFIGVANDVTQRIEDAKVLAYQASHDDLTGAYNRVTFEERLEREAGLVRRQNTLLVVLFIDLDDFKPINDALGHAMGDKLLAAVAERLTDKLRPGDTLGRFGGDEFMVLLTNLEHERQAQAIVDRLLAALSHPYQIDGHAFRLSASIGMASSREMPPHPEHLIVRADSAMYAAKKQGGNTAHWYRYQPGQALSGRVELRKDIQEAIEQEQFSLHYQPLMNHAGDVLGFEALIRWQHPIKGPISPASFIPVAEITGQIVSIGDWVLTQVCRDLPTLRRLGADGCRVAVNLSPMQFQRPAFLSSLNQRLRENDIPPHWLELEVTEGVLMEGKEAAISILKALREMGVSVAIDDFGTGFSSLSYLKSLPVSKIKIDRSFVSDVVTDPSDKAIVQGVISMARSMGLQVVAEGVETDEQWQYLVDQGCDIFQGYLLARPMPLDKVEAFLTTNP